MKEKNESEKVSQTILMNIMTMFIFIFFPTFLVVTSRLSRVLMSQRAKKEDEKIFRGQSEDEGNEENLTFFLFFLLLSFILPWHLREFTVTTTKSCEVSQMFIVEYETFSSRMYDGAVVREHEIMLQVVNKP